MICGTAPLLLIYSFFFYTPNQKYVGRKEWAIQAISVLLSAPPVLVQSGLPGFIKSSNKATNNLPYRLPPNLKCPAEDQRHFKYTLARARFPQMQFASGSAKKQIGNCPSLFEVEEVQPQNQMIHISDWSSWPVPGIFLGQR